MSLTQMGMDSLAIAQLHGQLEVDYGLYFSANEMFSEDMNVDYVVGNRLVMLCCPRSLLPTVAPQPSHPTVPCSPRVFPLSSRSLSLTKPCARPCSSKGVTFHSARNIFPAAPAATDSTVATARGHGSNFQDHQHSIVMYFAKALPLWLVVVSRCC